MSRCPMCDGHLRRSRADSPDDRIIQYVCSDCDYITEEYQ